MRGLIDWRFFFVIMAICVLIYCVPILLGVK